MPLSVLSFPRRFQRLLLLACTSTVLALLPVASGQQTKIDVLLIGTSGSMNSENASAKAAEDAGMETLKIFIKEETGCDNKITRQKNWRELADKLAKGELHLGVFQGYEFAWAQEHHLDLKPLAIAISVHRYPMACLVVKSDSQAKNFSDLKGQSLGIVKDGDGYLDLFLDKHCRTAGQKSEEYFSKITSPNDYEDALDQVVDGTLQVTLTNQSALEGFKRRKPGRFDKLKEIERSQAFPPPVVVTYGKVVDEATLKRVKEGLLGADKKAKGETVLTLFRVTCFEPVPPEFDKVLAETRKNYPAPKE